MSSDERFTPAIGMWWTFCCMLDLTQITTEADLAEVRELIAESADEPSSRPQLFLTREDAARVLGPEHV